jgi:hypothetical protein
MSQFAFSQRHALRLEVVHNRHNRDARGGSLGHVFVYPEWGLGVEADSERKHFLGDNYTKEHEVTLSHLFRQFGRFEMTSGIFHNSQKGAGVGIWGGFRF